MSDVRLVDLDVIKRYSLAIRQEHAPADEVLAALDASRAHVLAAMAPPDDPPRRTTRATRRRRPETTAADAAEDAFFAPQRPGVDEW